MTRRKMMLGGVAVLGAAALGGAGRMLQRDTGKAAAADVDVRKTDQEWREALTPAQYDVMREHGTERPWSSPLNDEKRAGTYVCAACEQPLFRSETKFESGTGWPSFYAPIEGAVGTSVDRMLFMTRTEIHCSRCGGHLGHVFDDGPQPTGKRYCMNGVALDFMPT